MRVTGRIEQEATEKAEAKMTDQRGQLLERGGVDATNNRD
jgi:hypothetical protein